MQTGFSRTKIWLAFGILFICGAFMGVGIANWGHAIKAKNNVAGAGIGTLAPSEVQNQGYVSQTDKPLETCEALERVLLNDLRNDDNRCDFVKDDFDTYKKLAEYGCEENRARYLQEIENKSAILDVACSNYYFGSNKELVDTRACDAIEQTLKAKYELAFDEHDLNVERRIDRAKAYAIMAEKGCPEHRADNENAARRELEIARGISDDKLNEDDTLEVVETYKRLKMQQDAEEVFNKVKKMTNPAIDFILQVEKIINE